MKHAMLNPARAKGQSYEDYVTDRRKMNRWIDQRLKEGVVFYAHPMPHPVPTGARAIVNKDHLVQPPRIPYVRAEWAPGGKYYQEAPENQ